MEDKNLFYEVWAQSPSGLFDIYINETTDLEIAVALARRYTDLHNVPCEVSFNDNKAAIIVNRRSQ